MQSGKDISGFRKKIYIKNKIKLWLWKIWEKKILKEISERIRMFVSLVIEYRCH